MDTLFYNIFHFVARELSFFRFIFFTIYLIQLFFLETSFSASTISSMFFCPSLYVFLTSFLAEILLDLCPNAKRFSYLKSSIDARRFAPTCAYFVRLCVVILSMCLVCCFNIFSVHEKKNWNLYVICNSKVEESGKLRSTVLKLIIYFTKLFQLSRTKVSSKV